MRPDDIATLRPNEALLWHKPGKRFPARVAFVSAAPPNYVRVDEAGRIRTVNVRNVTRPETSGQVTPRESGGLTTA